MQKLRSQNNYTKKSLYLVIMKGSFLILLGILPLLITAQPNDSVTIRQVDSLIKLSRALTGKSDFEKALEINAIAEKLALEKLGLETASYGSICFNYGRIMHFKTNFAEAEKWYKLSKDVREKLLGKNNVDYGWSLNNLGILNMDIGHYENAEPLLFESNAIWGKILGEEHPIYAGSLLNLANMYIGMGQYEKVEPLYLKVKSIWEKTIGKEDPQYTIVLLSLANVYMSTGNYDKAEVLLFEAKAIVEKVQGKENPLYARCLSGIASLYGNMGQYEKAEPLYLTATAILKNVLGQEHRDYGSSLLLLGRLYRLMGQYEKAEPLFIENKAILEKVVGKDHISYIQCLMRMGNLYRVMGQYEKADSFFVSYNTKMQGHILATLYLMSLSEKEMNQYLLTSAGDKNILFSFNQMSSGKTGISKTAYDNTLFYKGFLLNVSLHSKKLIHSNPVANEKNNLLQSYHKLLAVEYAKPISERKGITDLEEKSNTLEKEIAKIAVGYGQAMKQVNWQQVQYKLKTGEAAIEFVHYRYINNEPTDSTLYVALLLKPGEPKPQLINLFEERSLDSLLQSSNGLKADYVNGLYAQADRGFKVIQRGKRSLYEIVWKPLEHALEGIKTIYFSPSGLLHRINLDAIPVSETETLADKYQLIELNSTRQLVYNNEIEILNNEAVLYGGVNFDFLGDSTSRGGEWNYLPGTEKEVTALQTIMQSGGLKTTVKKGLDATEESFKKIGANNSASPKILHIATHGYFFPDPKDKAGNQQAFSDKEPVFKMSDNPMLRSGLILSGGNKGWDGIKTMEEKEDGVLTAYEISQMNLSNTELVVLSACETGLGTIQGNEGVYGLQRAFKIAGAKYLIMSLWQVPDKQTSVLMTTFYKKWLEEKMSIPKAFHEAQKQLRDTGLDPYYWAGFVLVE